jgi:hypothetical protein
MAGFVKLFQIRDVATCIEVFAYSPRWHPDSYAANAILSKGADPENLSKMVIVGRFSDGESHRGFMDWHTRTMQVAHKHINDNFENLPTGSVIDVEFLLGLKPTAITEVSG